MGFNEQGKIACVIKKMNFWDFWCIIMNIDRNSAIGALTPLEKPARADLQSVCVIVFVFSILHIQFTKPYERGQHIPQGDALRY